MVPDAVFPLTLDTVAGWLGQAVVLGCVLGAVLSFLSSLGGR